MTRLSVNQFAAMNMIYSRYSFEYFLDSMAKLEIRNFELWTGGTHPNNFVPSLRETVHLKHKINDFGMKIVCLTPEQCLYPQNIAVKNDELRDLSVKYFTDYLDMAQELEIDKMLCCAGWSDYDDDLEETWERSLGSLDIMLRHAKSRGVKLAFEILCPSESNLVYNIEGVRRVMDTFDDEAFGLCVDTVPIRLSGSSLKSFFDEFGKRICHVHLTDGKPTGHMPTGTGEHPISEYIDTLNIFKYEGFVTLEIGNPDWQTKPHEATEISFSTVRKLIEG